MTGVLSLAAGSVLGYYARQTIAKGQLNTAESKAAQIIGAAEERAKNEMVKAKNKAIEVLDQADEKMKEKEVALTNRAKSLDNKEDTIFKKLEEIDQSKKTLEKKAEQIRALYKEAEDLKADAFKQLEQASGYNKEEARNVLFEGVEKESEKTLAKRMSNLERNAQEELERKANHIMVQVIQRYARSHAADVMTSTVSIGSDELKGKIIGKEGRNIRTLEKLTGVEILIDDTPESVVVSSFDPIRREVAKIALEKLVEDGRINPARIEEVVKYAETEVTKRIKEAGETAVYEAGVLDLDPKLVQLLGSLGYRTSFKQNVLLHSLEVSFIAGALAAELGFDVKVAKKAGLLHDIGKAIDHKVEGTHVNIGIKILEKFKIDKKIILAMRSHHEEYPYATPEAYIITAADAISAGRPGARKNTVENYIKRLEELEETVNSFKGVEKTYAIQAGREVRVFVDPKKVNDVQAMKLARNIADKIEEELNYPGEIKVNVMRETRAVEIAR